MNHEELNIIELNGHNYFLFDTLSGNGNTYNFFANVENQQEICVLKDKVEGDEEFLVSLDSEDENDYAFRLFYEKHGNDE